MKLVRHSSVTEVHLSCERSLSRYARLPLKHFLATFVSVILIMSAASAQTGGTWQKWNDLRWSGLQAFKKGELETARGFFEQELKEARRIQPNGENEVVSIHDIAQVFQEEGKNQKAEEYYRQALQKSKKLGSSGGALTNLILCNLRGLRAGAGDRAGAMKLLAEADKISDASIDSRTIGAATMSKDGTIELNLCSFDGRIRAHAIQEIAPNNPGYKEILMHLGPLRPGGGAFVAPWK
jgi:tetratricopeptide (TPR) repeat protein